MLLLTKSTENKEMELHKNSICNIIWILFCQQEESMEHFKQGGSGIKLVSWKITVCKMEDEMIKFCKKSVEGWWGPQVG